MRGVFVPVKVRGVIEYNEWLSVFQWIATGWSNGLMIQYINADNTCWSINSFRSKKCREFISSWMSGCHWWEELQHMNAFILITPEGICECKC